MIHRIVGATIVGLFIVSTLLLGACQLGRGGQSPPASKTYLITIDAEDFTVGETAPTTVAIADHKVGLTAADVRDAVITAQLQFRGQTAWEPLPYTISGWVPTAEPRRSASVTLTYQVREEMVRLMATGDLTKSEMELFLRIFTGFKVRIRVVPTRAQ